MSAFTLHSNQITIPCRVLRRQNNLLHFIYIRNIWIRIFLYDGKMQLIWLKMTYEIRYKLWLYKVSWPFSATVASITLVHFLFPWEQRGSTKWQDRREIRRRTHIFNMLSKHRSYDVHFWNTTWCKGKWYWSSVNTTMWKIFFSRLSENM